ncbi:G5 domain-containing protein [Candidatus Daviesbacteria bacterium]|nr:G5 domain-containing protein [Candidatus Daviesbacteria bacterium]
MIERYLGILLIILLTVLAKNFWQPSAVLGQSTSLPAQTLPVNQPITTESSFTEKLEEETQNLPKKTIFEDDPDMEAGEEKVLEEGEDGQRVTVFKITYSNDGEEYQRDVVSTTNTQPKNKKVLRGTKIVWKTLNIPEGEIKYWKKMRVYATHYDWRCPGCNEWTAIGMRAGKGVVAVDPKVIPLRSKVYIPGYGIAIAGDTGGAIKDNKIDLGFDDAKTAGWKAHFIDIYLL